MTRDKSMYSGTSVLAKAIPSKVQKRNLDIQFLSLRGSVERITRRLNTAIRKGELSQIEKLVKLKARQEARAVSLAKMIDDRDRKKRGLADLDNIGSMLVRPNPIAEPTNNKIGWRKKWLRKGLEGVPIISPDHEPKVSIPMPVEASKAKRRAIKK